MLFIPISFVVALLILPGALFAARNIWAVGPLLPSFLGAMVLLPILHGLRWGYDVKALMPLQIVLALSAPPLAYVALKRLGEPPRSRDLGHAGLPAAAFLAGSIWPPLNDILIPALAFVYSLMVARAARQGSESLPGGRLSQSLIIQRSLWVCAAGLSLSGVTDVIVAIDIAVGGGRRAGLIISLAQTLGFVLAAAAIGLVGFCAPQPEDSEIEPDTTPNEDFMALVVRLDSLVREHGLHLSPDMTLNRLARRAHVPARQVSRAINVVKGESVSRYFNRFRVEEACRLLADSDAPVTSVMLSAGFQTKSNFNRAFKEITGSGPTEWRAMHRRDKLTPDAKGSAKLISLARRNP
jgi:AraC-like DNA-binding protein